MTPYVAYFHGCVNIIREGKKGKKENNYNYQIKL